MALAVALLVRVLLKKTEIDDRLAVWLVGEERAESIEIEKWISRGVFALLMPFVLVAFFEVLGLRMITEPLTRFLNQIFEYLPNLIGPAILVVAAFLVASGLRFVVLRVVSASKLDERLADQAGLAEGEAPPLSKTKGDAIYWLVFAAHVLLGLIIFVIGLFLADLASKTVLATGARQANMLALAGETLKRWREQLQG